MSWLYPVFDLWSNIVSWSRDMSWEMSGHLPNVMNPNLSILLSKAMRHVGLTIFPSYVPRSNGQWTVDCSVYMRCKSMYFRAAPCSCLVERRPGSHRTSWVQVGGHSRTSRTSGHSGVCMSCTRANPRASDRDGGRRHVWPEKQTHKPLWNGTWPSHVKLGRSVTTWTAIVAYSFLWKLLEIFLTFKFLLELNQMYNFSKGNKVQNSSKGYKNWISLLVWGGVMAV